MKTICTAIIWVLLLSYNSAAADGIGCPKGTILKEQYLEENKHQKFLKLGVKSQLMGTWSCMGHTVLGGLMESSGLKANMKIESRSDYGVAGMSVVNFKARNYLRMATK